MTTHTAPSTTAINQLPLPRMRVWDLPTRVFHWSMVVAFATAWFTRGSAQQLDVHVFSGYTMLGLVAFRLVWGRLGGTYARFAQLALNPHQVQRYAATLLTPQRQHYVGHNPLASVAIVALILLSIGTLLAGLLVLGGQKQLGPLAGWLSFEQGAFWGSIHEWLATALLALVAVHVLGAVAESLLQRDNLIAAMIHGRRRRKTNAPSSANFRPIGLLLVLTLTAAASVSYWPWLTQDTRTPYQPFTGPTLVQNAAWQDECGSCHLAYHPSLLPARSWQVMFDTQDAHFGEDLALDQPMLDTLNQYAIANAAEQQATETAWQINRRITPEQTPQRISDTRYWKAQHRAITDTVWRLPAVKSKANCDACHSDAQAGTFQPAAMHVPGSSAERLRLNLQRYAKRIFPLSSAVADTQPEITP